MTEDIKNLIEKIQQEGIQAAEEKAREIEVEARSRAKEILEEAQAEAEDLISQAKEKNARKEESTQETLKQAGRDLLISLKKEINAILEKLIVSRVGEALKPEELIKIITALVKDYKGQEKGQVIISLKKEDLEKLENGFSAELKEQVKKGITLKPSEEILGGLIISFDAGKSHFDFTDQALAEYIGTYLKPKLKGILKDNISGNKKT
ncbi:MAG: V-type ATP synthase subunit E family protein [Candidatus Omnitrophota bacterium]|nr:V-type ATP synthase subunit E family protein [Candidatus Omnitrophota bacterium]